jgi:pimeloyl-ACP methyl ester carboxylesterase
MNVAGRTLEVVAQPPREAGLPTLVFLHEGLGSMALWRAFPQKVAESTGCGSLVYSRYGNGFSEVLQEPRAPAYMHDEALITLPQLLERFEIERPILIGHSDGASIALIYAAAFPQNVRGLVVEAPHVIVEDVSVTSIAAIGDAYKTTTLRERMERYHADVDATFYGWNTIWRSREFRDWSIVDRLDAVVAPVLAIQGMNDEYGTLEQLELLARHVRGPVDRLVLARCGHAPHRDRAALVESAVVAWLREALLSP